MHSRDWFQYNIKEPSSDIIYALYPPARIAFRVYGRLPAPRKSNRLKVQGMVTLLSTGHSSTDEERHTGSFPDAAFLRAAFLVRKGIPSC